MALKKSQHGNSTGCHYWGYSFHWTNAHRSEEELRPLIYTCDTLADDCVQLLNKIPVDSDSDRPYKKDLYALLKDHADDDPNLLELWTQINTVPDWVDWEQIQRAQDVFFRYGLPILNAVSLAKISSSEASLLTGLPYSLALKAYSVGCMATHP